MTPTEESSSAEDLKTQLYKELETQGGFDKLDRVRIPGNLKPLTFWHQEDRGNVEVEAIAVGTMLQVEVSIPWDPQGEYPNSSSFRLEGSGGERFLVSRDLIQITKPAEIDSTVGRIISLAQQANAIVSELKKKRKKPLPYIKQSDV